MDGEYTTTREKGQNHKSKRIPQLRRTAFEVKKVTPVPTADTGSVSLEPVRGRDQALGNLFRQPTDRIAGQED